MCFDSRQFSQWGGAQPPVFWGGGEGDKGAGVWPPWGWGGLPRPHSTGGGAVSGGVLG